MGPNKKIREGAEPMNPLDENLVNEIFFSLFWRNLKNEDSRAKKRFLEGSEKAWGKKSH